MSKNYSIEIIDGIIVTRFSKIHSFSDCVSAIQDVAKIDNHGRRLWDLSCGLDLEDTSSATAQKLAEISKNAFPGLGKTALVAPEDFTFGMAREHNFYRGKENCETEVFHTEQEALVWLKK